MRAIWYERQGAASEVLTLGERAEPLPGPGEVAVTVQASGVNPSDVKIRSGARGPMTADLQIPHSDGAGIIKAVGEGVDPARLGERVWLFSAAYKRVGGTCAEVCVLPAEHAVPLPDQISVKAGAALGIPAMTAHRALFCNGGVADKTVLVTGGAGAVGHSAIQIAKWAGAEKIITTVSSAAKAAIAMAAGADHVINYRQQDVVEAVLADTQGAGVDHVVEVELGGNLAQSAQMIAEHGTIAWYGSESVREPVFAAYPLMFRNVTLHGVFLYAITPEQRASAVADITSALEAGLLRPLIDSVWSLEDTVKAHERVESGERSGAVIVQPSGG
ncbi:NADPH:quinone reductase [Glycocaulis sp.]|uniref:NADPH:quinone reductase n=1 Tax=Glycocaulis sp. TaxID=1969725 RepID=UPI003D1B6AC2